MRAKRGSSLRPSRAKAAVALRLEFQQSEHPGLSARRLRKWYELRLSRNNWGTRWHKWASLKGEDLLAKAEAGDWWPAMLPEFKAEKSDRAKQFLGWCNLAFRVLGKPGLAISIPKIQRLLGCSHGTATRMLAKLITGESDGRIMEALRGEGGPQHWLIPRHDLPPSRTKCPTTGKELKSWQLCNWYEPGPLMIAAWKADADRREKKAAKKAGASVAPPAQNDPKNGMPSPCDLISNCHKSAEPPIAGPEPKASAGALFEGDKVSPSATVETESTTLPVRQAGSAGQVADQEGNPAPPRALGARFVPLRPISPSLLEEIRLAVAAGGDETWLMRSGQSDPELAMRLACLITGRPRPTLTPNDEPDADEAMRDPRWHTRRPELQRAQLTRRSGP